VQLKFLRILWAFQVTTVDPHFSNTTRSSLSYFHLISRHLMATNSFLSHLFIFNKEKQLLPFYWAQFFLDVRGSVHHSIIQTEKSKKMQQCIKIYYSIFI
jgi:hypothetical protein